jgi:DNA-binding MurR/RpiR family transcriptional regulator
MNDFTQNQLKTLDRNERIAKAYQAMNPDGTRKYLTEHIARDFGVSVSTVKRAARAWGVAQSHAAANAGITHLKRPTRRRQAASPAPRRAAQEM